MCLRIAAVSVLRIKGTAHIRRTHEMLTCLVSAWEKKLNIICLNETYWSRMQDDLVIEIVQIFSINRDQNFESTETRGERDKVLSCKRSVKSD